MNADGDRERVCEEERLEVKEGEEDELKRIFFLMMGNWWFQGEII